MQVMFNEEHSLASMPTEIAQAARIAGGTTLPRQLPLGVRSVLHGLHTGLVDISGDLAGIPRYVLGHVLWQWRVQCCKYSTLLHATGRKYCPCARPLTSY